MTPTVKIELTEADVCTAIAHYINDKPQWVNGQHVYDSDVKLEVGIQYGDRNEGNYPQFKKAIVTINQG